MKKSSIKAVFVDIWDTCLIRTCAFPTDVFREAAKRYLRLQPEYDQPAIETEIQMQRVEAEAAARRSAPSMEPSLDEIFLAWSDKNPLCLDLQLLMTLELEVEKSFVRPILETRQALERYRSDGLLVRFVSDMYLPADFLEELLRLNHFFQEGDRVYVSNEFRAKKSTGKLYPIVLSKERLSREECIHIGDNSIGDYEMPRKMGIDALLFKASRLNRYERQALDLLKTDPEIGSRIAGAMRSARLETLAGAEKNFEWLAAVAAPLLTFFTADTVRLARTRNLKRLYFLSRDAEILFQIARVLPRHPNDPEPRYLYSSRKSWAEAAIDPADPASLRWLKIFPQRPANLLAKLGFTQSESELIFRECAAEHYNLRKEYTSEELAPLWSIIQETRWLSLAGKRAAAKRANLLSYLASEGLTSGEPFGIVDVGWSLTLQRSLKRILDGSSGGSCHFEGFYLSCRRERAPHSETGPWHSWFSTVISSPACFTDKITTYSPVIEELFFKTAAPSVIGFAVSAGNRAEPVFDNSPPSNPDIEYCERIRRVVLNFAQTIGGAAETLSARPDIRLVCASLLEMFLDSPDRTEAARLVQFGHASDALHGKEQEKALVSPYNLIDVADVLLQRLTRKQWFPIARRRIWEEASRSVTHPVTLQLLQIALASPRGAWTRLRRGADSQKS